MGALQEIMKFQSDRGLDKKVYSAPNEHANIVEELFESMGFDVPKENRSVFKDAFTQFCVDMVNGEVAVGSIGGEPSERVIEKDNVVDAYSDVIVFAVGALMKLGYDPEKALLETAKEINSRVGEMVDGKFEKDLSPEAKTNWYKADYSKASL